MMKYPFEVWEREAFMKMTNPTKDIPLNYENDIQVVLHVVDDRNISQDSFNSVQPKNNDYSDSDQPIEKSKLSKEIIEICKESEKSTVDKILLAKKGDYNNAPTPVKIDNIPLLLLSLLILLYSVFSIFIEEYYISFEEIFIQTNKK